MTTGEEHNTVVLRAQTRRRRVADYLGLERNVVIVSTVVFLLGTGEELWKKFLPKYMESLGAGVGAIGLFGTFKDFCDAIYQYPGGWLADRLGRRNAFTLFILLSSVGYLIYFFSPSWEYIFLGLVFTMAWSSMASPAIFAVIGDALPREKRALGFTVQSILKRVPMAFAPIIGGAIVASLGVVAGVRLGLIIMLALATGTAIFALAIRLPVIVGEPADIKGIWRSFHAPLKHLLVSDIIIRTCEGMAEVFIILYITNITGISLIRYGTLVAVQMTTSILVYIPAAKVADRIGRKPFVIATFICFSFFPIAVVMAQTFGWLVIAFVIGGMREIGEPSRKAMIVDLAEPHIRARTVGLYYLIRSLMITPAATVGGLLWKFTPSTPFLVAGVIGLIGTCVFVLTVSEREAA